ncbi:ABC transporter permease subunit [Galbitalea sp. SE-J8]|uniref:ABC transporter permease n=1 Tax=Galbitalea sp. SE-J8 TaxID=3054952 RepID=UPI00259C8D28|nr:ABC transporter permease subunit [Galbitalea sp. SE-J8]MDM4762934.1 ABC transporter permease subunit [Galbitalea sp. SE-J8]
MSQALGQAQGALAGSAARGRVRTVVAPLVLGVAIVLLWQAATVVLAIKPFVLPAPFAIGARFADRIEFIVPAALATGWNALLGLVVGAVVGILIAALAAAVRPIEQLGAPIATALSVIPIVSLAPVFYTMFDSSTDTTRVIVAAIAVFVPVYFNTLRGLLTSLPVHRDLMRAYAATGWQTTRTVTLPGALPFLFTGLRIASSLAVISSLVAEYFGGPVTGLGKAVTSAVSSSDYPLAWAFVIGAIVTGLAFYLVTYAIELIVLRHRRR